MSIVTIGVDIAKSVFQVHGVDACGETVLRKRLPRNRFLNFMRSTPPCLVGMEACGSSNHWARELMKLGHEVKLMPGQYVKPYVKRNKTDAADAEAICEAVTRPSMRFVAVRTAESQTVLLQHRSRELLVKQRTMLVNAVRGHMAEFGVVAPKGLPNIARLKTLLDEHAGGEIPVLAGEILVMLFAQIDALQKRIAQEHRTNEASQRLASIPGVGPLIASAILATVGDAKAFKSGREFAAWLGLTPSEHSSGGKRRIGSISKRGDGYLRRLLAHGARAVVRKGAAPFPWLDGLLERRQRNMATVALANKNARMVWALLTRGDTAAQRPCKRIGLRSARRCIGKKDGERSCTGIRKTRLHVWAENARRYLGPDLRIPSGPAVSKPHQQAGYIPANDPSRRQFRPCKREPSIHTRDDIADCVQV